MIQWCLAEAGPCVGIPKTTPRFGDSQGKDTELKEQRAKALGGKSGGAQIQAEMSFILPATNCDNT